MDGINIPIYSDVLQLKKIVKPYNSMWLNKNLVDVINNFNNKISYINRNISDVLNTIGNDENVIRSLKNQIENINNQINNLNNLVNKNKGDIKDIENELSTLESKIKNINGEISDVINKSNKAYDSTKQGLNGIVNTLNGLESGITNFKNSIDNLRKNLPNINTSCNFSNIKNILTKLKTISVKITNPFGLWKKYIPHISYPNIESNFYNLMLGIYDNNYSIFKDGYITYIDPLSNTVKTCNSVAELIVTMLRKGLSHLNYVVDNKYGAFNVNTWDDARAGWNLITGAFSLMFTYIQSISIHTRMINSFGVNNVGLKSCGKGCIVIAWTTNTLELSGDPHPELKNWVRIYIHDNNGNLTDSVHIKNDYFDNIQKDIQNKVNAMIDNANKIIAEFIISKLQGEINKSVDTGISSYLKQFWKNGCGINGMDKVNTQLSNMQSQLNNLKTQLDNIRKNIQNILNSMG